MFIILLFLFSFSLTSIKGQDPCSNQHTCNECIQTKGCSWCSDPNLNDVSRCVSSYLNRCTKTFVENPKNEAKMIMNINLTKGKAQNGKKIVQVQPQQMSLKLRVSK